MQLKTTLYDQIFKWRYWIDRHPEIMLAWQNYPLIQNKLSVTRVKIGKQLPSIYKNSVAAWRLYWMFFHIVGLIATCGERLTRTWGCCTVIRQLHWWEATFLQIVAVWLRPTGLALSEFVEALLTCSHQSEWVCVNKHNLRGSTQQAASWLHFERKCNG